MVVKKLLFVLLVISLFLVSCKGAAVNEIPLKKDVPEQLPQVVDKVAEEPKNVSCKINADCEQGLLCINGGCGKIADLYDTDCENKCTIKSVAVLTSDGENYNLKLGQGSYSYAGALEWRLLSTPKYCPGDKPLVPINLIKKSYGKVLSKEVITLREGETSGVITHPTVKRVKFTTTLKEVKEVCS